MSINFNEKSNEAAPATESSEPAENVPARRKEDVFEREIRTGERTRFVHKPNPLVERDYQIFEYNGKTGTYDHVGDYVLVNKKEPRDITEKKLMNIMAMLNQKGEMIDISSLTKKRLLYTMVPEAQAGNQTKMIFKEYDGSGVSKDNAVFTIRKGVFDG